MAKWVAQKEWGGDRPVIGQLHLMSHVWTVVITGWGIREDSVATFHALNSFSVIARGVVFDASPHPCGSASKLFQLVDSSVTLAVIV